jgi:hypothetical protein
MISVIKKENAKMTAENFCYWLQGLLELTPDLKALTEAQVKMVRDHLGYVFTHVNPPVAQPAVPPGNFDLRKAIEAMGTTAMQSPQSIGSIC